MRYVKLLKTQPTYVGSIQESGGFKQDSTLQDGNGEAEVNLKVPALRKRECQNKTTGASENRNMLVRTS